MSDRETIIGAEGSNDADPLITRVKFDSDDYPESERSDAYQSIVASPARMTPLAEPFYARITGFLVGPIRFHSVAAIPHRFERSMSKIDMDTADYLVVQHIIEGEVTGDCDGAPLQASAGSVYCLNFRQPSILVEGGPTRLNFVTVSRSVAEDRYGDLRAFHGAVFSAEHAAPYIAHLSSVYPKLPEMRQSDIRGVVSKTLAELGKLLAPAISSANDDLFQRAKNRIATRLGSRDLTPETIATSLGISRSQLYVLFHDHGGVAKYIWDQRCRQVHAALSDPGDDRTLTELAIDLGFTSPAHLSSLFRRTYGQAPSRVRQSRRND